MTQEILELIRYRTFQKLFELKWFYSMTSFSFNDLDFVETPRTH
jgi:hypothetical protein